MVVTRGTLFFMTWYPATSSLSVEASQESAISEAESMVPVIPVGILGGVVSGDARVVADTERRRLATAFPAASLSGNGVGYR